jgi:cell division protein ZipA
MNELRWILLVAGLLLIAAIYAWGLRARRRAAAPEHERMTRVEPARTVQVVPEPEDVAPEVADEEAPFEEARPDDSGEFDAEPTPRPARSSGRREPRLEPQFDDDFDVEPPTIRLEPAAAPPPEPPRKPAPQKIVAVRVVAPAGSQFAGEQLLDAIEADGFTFGRYQIFHRLDDAGRPVVSLASLKEPGTFDPAAMPGAQFRGIALFAVMPGPLPGVRAFDELIVTARALAATLGGQLQDERGGPLSLSRLGHLREEVAEFERARGAAADG